MGNTGGRASPQHAHAEAGARSSGGGEGDEEPPAAEVSAAAAAAVGADGRAYWSQFKESYDEIIQSIIRPPRVEYGPAQLGPATFRYGGRAFARADFELRNRRGLRLCVSHWHRPDLLLAPAGGADGGGAAAAPSLRSAQPCVVFLHHHAGCRLDAIPLLRALLGIGASVLALDLGGHGQSEGAFVSLGWHERDDVADVLAFARAQGHAGPIGLWGQYTGAVAALMHGDRDPSIGCLVLEGAVADIKQLIAEWTVKGREHGYAVPAVLVRAGLSLVRRTVRARAGFEPYALKPLEKVGQCYIPALFVVTDDDPIVGAHHGRQLHAAYGGEASLLEAGRFLDGAVAAAAGVGDVAGAGGRAHFALDSAAIFIASALRVDAELAIDATDAAANGARSTSPPWVSGGGLLGRGSGGDESRNSRVDAVARWQADDDLDAPSPRARAEAEARAEGARGRGPRGGAVMDSSLFAFALSPQSASESPYADEDDGDDDDALLAHALELSLAEAAAGGAGGARTRRGS